jgi:hypothetical protein
MNETIRAQECCYLSTPRHVRSLVGRFIYVYTAKGSLRLTSEALIFTSKKLTIEIPLDSIAEISSGHYSRIAKPLRLYYIAVRYNHEGREETILLTPTQSWAMRVGNTNKIVASWRATLDGIVPKK